MLPAVLVGLCAVLWLVGCDSREERQSDIAELQHQGRFAETIEPLRSLLEEDPTDPLLNRLYGEALLRMGQAGSAVWPLRRAAESPDQAVEAGLLLARALLMSGSETDSIEAASRVLEREPNQPIALGLRAQAHLEAMQEEAALEDLDLLLEEQPDEIAPHFMRVIAFLRLQRIDEAAAELDAIDAKLVPLEKADPSLLAQLCVVKASFERERGRSEEAEAAWRGCLASYPTDGAVVSSAVEFYAGTGQGDRVTEVLREAFEKAPGQRELREAYATRLRVLGRNDEARDILLEGVREYPSPAAYGALAQHYSEVGDVEAARKVVEQSFEIMDDVPEAVRFVYGDVLIQAGDLDAAERVIDELELPVYRHLLEGRLLLQRGDPAGARAALEEGIRLWPNNTLARHLAGQACEQLGDFTAAASHYREGVRSLDPESAVALAELYDAQGQPSAAMEVLNSALSKLTNDRSLWLTFVRIASSTPGSEQAAHKGLRALAGLWGGAPLATVEAFRVRVRSAGPKAALKWLLGQPIDLLSAGNESILAAAIDAQLSLGELDEAAAQVDAAIAARPEAAGPQALRGRVLAARGSLDEAESAYRRALELDPDSAAALAGLGGVEAQRGRRDEAIALYDRADRSDPEDPEPGWSAYLLVAESAASPDERAARLERFLRAHPRHAAAALSLAELRLAEGDLAGSLAMAKRAVGFLAGAPGVELVARIQLEMDDPRAAVETLGRMNPANLGQPSAQFWLGTALARSGEVERAREALRNALGGGPYTERARQELARLERDASS
jgi:tetratricopeptide (TPR) repeat protein